jgi:peptidoglycan-N-acetylglucosamine deacetylase
MRFPERFSFPEGARAAVSLTFDDSRASQLDRGMAVLARHGVHATFYLEPRVATKRLDEWRAVLAAGHEIGNHTMTHACSGNFQWDAKSVLEDKDLAWIEEDILTAQRWIEEHMGVSPTTFAYPCGQPFVGRGEQYRSYVPVVSKHFIAGRGFMDEPLNDPSFCDLPMLNGYDSDEKTFDELVAILDRAREEGAWVVFASHEVGAPGDGQAIPVDVLDALCAYCKNPANGIWIDTVDAIATAIQEQRG